VVNVVNTASGVVTALFVSGSTPTPPCDEHPGIGGRVSTPVQRLTSELTHQVPSTLTAPRSRNGRRDREETHRTCPCHVSVVAMPTDRVRACARPGAARVNAPRPSRRRCFFPRRGWTGGFTFLFFFAKRRLHISDGDRLSFSFSSDGRKRILFFFDIEDAYL
jgi:hypothetical protein